MSNPSTHPGMGAIPYNREESSGVTFRIWAKFASEVFVAGTFNGWSTSLHPLASEGNGYWSADIDAAEVNHRYRYFIKSPFVPQGHWRTDPYCKNVEDNDTGDGVIITDTYDWTEDKFKMPGWNELIIYELHTASFNRSKAVPGNFSSLISKLDYLRDLGINAIEIMPVFGFPGDFSLGYNPALPFDIESNYGTATEFKNFVRAAHQRGIAVILDIVLNHFGPDDLDTSLWQLDGWNENGKGGIYFYNDWRSKTAFGDRPDYGRPEVRSFLKDCVMLWLEEYHIDGLRFDSTVNIRNAKGNNGPIDDLPEGWSLMQWINSEIDRKLPWKLTTAEDLQNNEWVTRKTGEGGAGFDSQWDSLFYWKILDCITTSDDRNRDMYQVKEAIQHKFDGDATKRTIYINNHDECAEINGKYRLNDRIWFGNTFNWVVRKKYCLAAAILFTTPGIPMIFMGDEFFENGSWRDSGSVDWSKRQSFTGIWDLFQSLIRLRRNWYNNTNGLKGQYVNVFHTNNTDKLIAFHRWEKGGPGDDVIVVANFSNTGYQNYRIGFPRQGKWFVRFNSDWNGYSNDFSNQPGYHTNTVVSGYDGFAYSGNIGIGPYTVLIFSQ